MMNDCSMCGGSGTYLKHKCSSCLGTGKTGHMFYAGIGSRDTPEPILQRMSTIAMQLAMRGVVLRSGMAKGADKAFEGGCDMVRGNKVIRCATQWQRALDHAALFHPNWNACNDNARALHARNSMIMLGDNFDLPVSFVVCWTKNGGVVGGTGQGLRIATAYNIPVYNLFYPEHDAALTQWLSS